jgi:predicted RNase H-like HicB family nuclease
LVDKPSFFTAIHDLLGGEVLQLIREAIEFHLEGMKKQGLAIPEPKSISELVDIS